MMAAAVPHWQCQLGPEPSASLNGIISDAVRGRRNTVTVMVTVTVGVAQCSESAAGVTVTVRLAQ